MRPKYQTNIAQTTKRIAQITCLACGLVLILQIGCQEQSKPAEKLTAATTEPGENMEEIEIAPKPGGPAPKIVFEKEIYDFGKVGPSAKQTGEFKFTNEGKVLLKITKVGRCCGIVTKMDKMEYEPGESGVLKVEWNSSPRESTMNRQLNVYSNDPITPQVRLTVKAKVVLQVTWEPKRLNLVLDEENAGCPNITISSLDDQPFSILGFKSTADCITADYDSSVKATQFVLKPKVDTDKLQTNLRGRINISLNHPRGNSAIVPFSVLAKYKITPPLLIIFNAEPGKPIVRTISVLDNYGKGFEIDSISSKNGTVGMKLLEQKKISDGYQLEVEITPPATEGKTRFMDTFDINIKGDEKMAIKCNGYFKKGKPKPLTR
jgi:hypothetical protein